MAAAFNRANGSTRFSRLAIARRRLGELNRKICTLNDGKFKFRRDRSTMMRRANKRRQQTSMKRDERSNVGHAPPARRSSSPRYFFFATFRTQTRRPLSGEQTRRRRPTKSRAVCSHLPPLGDASVERWRATFIAASRATKCEIQAGGDSMAGLNIGALGGDEHKIEVCAFASQKSKCKLAV